MSGLGGVRNQAYIHDESPVADSDDVYTDFDTKTMKNGGVSNITLYEIYVCLTD